MKCHLIMDPYRHLRLHFLNTPFHHCWPSKRAFRSTFDRLPYGCLLFMYE